MTTAQMINLAAEHCENNCGGDAMQTEMIICQYASDEKGLNEAQAHEYYLTSTALGSQEDYNQFMTWYYFNIICLPTFEHLAAVKDDAYLTGHPEFMNIIENLPVSSQG